MQKDKFFELFCKYDGCNFCVRYSYQEIESGIQTADEISEQNSVFNFNNYIQKEQIKYSIKHLRTLNFNHSEKAHKLARVKPMHSICDHEWKLVELQSLVMYQNLVVKWDFSPLFNRLYYSSPSKALILIFLPWLSVFDFGILGCILRI